MILSPLKLYEDDPWLQGSPRSTWGAWSVAWRGKWPESVSSTRSSWGREMSCDKGGNCMKTESTRHFQNQRVWRDICWVSAAPYEPDSTHMHIIDAERSWNRMQSWAGLRHQVCAKRLDAFRHRDHRPVRKDMIKQARATILPYESEQLVGTRFCFTCHVSRIQLLDLPGRLLDAKALISITRGCSSSACLVKIPQ